MTELPVLRPSAITLLLTRQWKWRIVINSCTTLITLASSFAPTILLLTTGRPWNSSSRIEGSSPATLLLLGPSAATLPERSVNKRMFSFSFYSISLWSNKNIIHSSMYVIVASVCVCVCVRACVTATLIVRVTVCVYACVWVGLGKLHG